jgi:hypothetical protein
VHRLRYQLLPSWKRTCRRDGMGDAPEKTQNDERKNGDTKGSLPWSKQSSTGVTLPESGGEESRASTRQSKAAGITSLKPESSYRSTCLHA